jgi:seryl-tRNA synthetase
MARRGDPELIEQLDHAADLDVRLRRLTARRDDLRRQVKELSQQVGQLRRSGDTDKADTLAAESRALGDDEAKLADEGSALEAELRDVLLRIPNIPSELAPDGSSEADNPVVKGPIGMPDAFADHQRVPHWETGRELGILDNERAVKISGAMFTMLRGLGATLGRALCQMALDRNADAFEEIRPPSLVTTETFTSTGQLPKFADDAYAIERDDLWCIPTAEVPLTSMGAGEILDEADLPMRFMAATPCYRREAGSAGRDTRGMLRGHEFDKVEILAYTTPDAAPAMLEDMIARAEGSIAVLGLPYRIIEISTGDLGQSHHRSFDIEVYAPGCDAWLEVSSISWFSDYQARRADVRYRPAGAKGTTFVHTLNGSALAVPRVWAAIVENGRQPDGSVALPEVLWPYLRGHRAIPARGIVELGD